MEIVTLENLIHSPKFKPSGFEPDQSILKTFTGWIGCILDKSSATKNPKQAVQILQFAENFLSIKAILKLVFVLGKGLHTRFVAKPKVIQIKINGILPFFLFNTINDAWNEYTSLQFIIPTGNISITR